MLTRVLGRHPFLGYRGPREQSTRKLVSDVRRRGDVYFNTGDVLALDGAGFLYFRDRLGDTFRSGPGWGRGLGAPGTRRRRRSGGGGAARLRGRGPKPRLPPLQMEG